ncbi:transcriptional Coactivator p15-domain-containing protein, partial [Russula aff. rugulosa BPL654]
KLQTNSEGEMYLDLGRKKRVTVRSFKGNTLVDIREYYGADGEEKPGKKAFH